MWVADALPGRVSHSVTGPPQTPPWPQQQDKQKTNKYSAQINVQLENTEVVVSSPPITPSPKLGASSSPPALLTKALCTQKLVSQGWEPPELLLALVQHSAPPAQPQPLYLHPHTAKRYKKPLETLGYSGV